MSVNTSKSSIFLKLIFVGFLILILLILLMRVEQLVYERQARHSSVIQEVSERWGYAQTMTGPMLTVPYQTFWKDDKDKVHTQLHKAQFLPDELTIVGDIVPQIRSRGIFEAVVYRVNLQFQGSFPSPDLSHWKIDPAHILWEDAIFSLGISDTRGIRDALFLEWDKQPVEFLSGAGNNGFFDKGLHVRLPQLASDTGKSHQFSLAVSLNGNHQLQFTPVGKKTMVTIGSPWPDPSFDGAFLPIHHEITPTSFQAKCELRVEIKIYKSMSYKLPLNQTFFIT
jgi:inner membrane protein